MKALLLLFASFAANAGSLEVSYTLPTSNTDGGAIPASGLTALKDTTVQYVQCASAASANWASPASVTAALPTTSVVLSGLPIGQRYCVRLIVSNNGGETSAPTVVAEAVVQSGPVFTGAEVSYVIQQVDKFVLLGVGTAPSGTLCDCAQSVNGFCVVPRASVTWYGTVKPLAVVGECH